MFRRFDLPERLTLATGLYLAVAWCPALADWMWFQQALGSPGEDWPRWLPQDWLYWLLFLPELGFAALWLVWAKHWDRIRLAAACTFAYVLVWHFAVFATDSVAAWITLAADSQETAMLFDAVCAHTARIGTVVLFLIGLAWVVWGLERTSQHYDRQRLEQRLKQAEDRIRQAIFRTSSDSDDEPRVWNPLDPQAWYYGRKSKKLNQSTAGFLSYSLLFTLAFLLFTQAGGCREVYEMPAGGGEQAQLQQVVKVQKVIRKRYVVNPFSAISFKVPPIDEVQLQLNEITKHAYTVGYGAGAGAGFAGGTRRGKVRFIRLEYSGGDWNQDFGKGADLNMLIEYNSRTTHKVANETEARTVAQLGNFEMGKSPPFVFMTGQRNISLSKSEIETLNEYLLEKHGMLFIDNGGSSHFHRQVISMMQRVLPNVRPVAVPLDDKIHSIPYQIPFLPYVAPHGGKTALGWKVDGRWVCYYHPGDIADAWSDGHAGVKPEVWEACYQLGTNIIFYAHSEYSKWLEAREKKP